MRGLAELSSGGGNHQVFDTILGFGGAGLA